MKLRAICLDLGLLAILPIMVFLLFYHPSILDPNNFGWLLRGSDNGENALGLHAWLNDPGTGLSLSTRLLNAPQSMPLLFTDSNPLLAMLVAPLARWMGPNLQFVGPYVLLCLILQTIFARALLRPYAPSRTTLWLGVAVFMLLPSLYVRYIHANLQSHWLLLWALWVFVDARRARDPRWWIAVLGVAALIHNYMLLLVAAVWASAMLERFINERGWRDRSILVAGAGATAVAVVLIVSRLGIDFDFLPTHTYGVYGMAMDALWNPSNPSYSVFLPAIEQQQGRDFEGFQYLGLGFLVLIACVPFVAWRTPPAEPTASLHARLLWLIPACVVLTVLAISHSLNWQGHTVLLIRLSYPVLAMLDPIRASGRLFWIVAYVILLAAVTIAYRLSAKRGAQVLLLVVFVQFMDLTGMMSAIRRVTADADRYKPFYRTVDPRWATAIANARDVTFAPAKPTKDLDLFQEVAWRAVAAGKPVRVVYAARDTLSTLARLKVEDADFAGGRLVPDRLYVLLPSTPVPAAATSRLLTLDGVRVLVPMSKGLSYNRAAR
ncbi:DUF6311 domain-containing protein [Sphingomonas sp.]|uniref:DUF6311 domain-containing protein n=1 Tax=Sphingomonas sp. TaxID=28214 RepID=UPI0025E25C49|nr:DUF6311 domain-containing protein [Sphingomonas sp.]